MASIFIVAAKRTPFGAFGKWRKSFEQGGGRVKPTDQQMTNLNDTRSVLFHLPPSLSLFDLSSSSLFILYFHNAASYSMWEHPPLICR